MTDLFLDVVCSLDGQVFTVSSFIGCQPRRHCDLGELCLSEFIHHQEIELSFELFVLVGHVSRPFLTHFPHQLRSPQDHEGHFVVVDVFKETSQVRIPFVLVQDDIHVLFEKFLHIVSVRTGRDFGHQKRHALIVVREVLQDLGQSQDVFLEVLSLEIGSQTGEVDTEDQFDFLLEVEDAVEEVRIDEGLSVPCVVGETRSVP